MNNSTASNLAESNGSIVAAMFLSLMMIVSIILNLIVCVAIVCCRKLRTSTSAFLFNLCIADILLTVVGMSIWLGVQLEGISFFSKHFPRKWIYYSWVMVDIICGCSSILSLMAISIAKYMAITRPLTYKSFINQRSNSVALFFIWAYSISVSSAAIIEMSHLTRAVFLATSCFAVPLCVILMTYGKIYVIARSHAQLLNRQAGRKEAKEIKATKTIAVVVGAFCACWVPFFVASLLVAYVRKLPISVNNAVKWMQYISAFLNPLIYTLFDRRFRHALRGQLLNALLHWRAYQYTETKPVSCEPGEGESVATRVLRRDSSARGFNDDTTELAEC